jgi:hypothetical protein
MSRGWAVVEAARRLLKLFVGESVIPQTVVNAAAVIQASYLKFEGIELKKSFDICVAK